MENIDKSELKEAIFNLFLWQNTNQDHFTIQVFKLISKADYGNREHIRKGFPVELFAYELWEAAPNEKKFFEEWGYVK